MSGGCAASSPSAERSHPAASRGAARDTSGSSRGPSAARGRWPSCPTPPSRNPAMKIILLDDVPKLGRRGEVRDVSDGYARNYLLPHKLALNATPGNLRNIETIKAAQEGRAVRMRSEAETQAQRIEGLIYAQSRSASDEGRLFGSVGKADIA